MDQSDGLFVELHSEGDSASIAIVRRRKGKRDQRMQMTYDEAGDMHIQLGCVLNAVDVLTGSVKVGDD